MTAPFDPASWIRCAEASGLAPRADGDGLTYNETGTGPALDVLAELNFADEEQWRPKVRAMVAYLRSTTEAA